jgi:hypothetical protein
MVGYCDHGNEPLNNVAGYFLIPNQATRLLLAISQCNLFYYRSNWLLA